MQFLSAGSWPQMKALVVSQAHLTSESTADLLKGKLPKLESLDLASVKQGYSYSNRLLR